MGLGIERKKVYVTIKDGKVVKKENGYEEVYDYIEGRLTGLCKVTREINGVDIDFYQLDVDDLTLSLRADTGLIMSILNCLASVDGAINTIKIRPYQKDNFNKAIVSNEGQRLNWKYSEIPKKDSKSWGLFIQGLVEDIQGKINIEEPF